MIELAIGTRFYHNGKLCKVVEVEYKYNRCSECDVSVDNCSIMECFSTERKDGKYVCFKRVEE